MENFFNHFKWMKRQKGGRQTHTKSFKLSLKIAETTLKPFHMQNLQIEINQLEMTLTYHT